METKSASPVHPVELIPVSFHIHARRLLRQLLIDASIPNHVFREEHIFNALTEAVSKLDPDVQNDADMDLRNNLKVKPVIRDCQASPAWIDGLLYAAVLPLKWESQWVSNAKIMVINFGIVPTEGEQGLTTFNDPVGKEDDHVSKLVNSIVKLGPTLVLVKGNVSSHAIENLTRAGIAVAHNIKGSILKEVGAFTGATVISSADQFTNSSIALGNCGRFEVKRYRLKGNNKLYYMFRGIPGKSVGTIVLRGNDEKLLKRMKPIMMTMAYALYNMKLERSLLLDQFASQSIYLQPFEPDEAPRSFRGMEQTSDDMAFHPAKRPTLPSKLTTRSTPCLSNFHNTSSGLDSRVVNNNDIICTSVSPLITDQLPAHLPSRQSRESNGLESNHAQHHTVDQTCNHKENNNNTGNAGKAKKKTKENTFVLVTPEMLHRHAAIPKEPFNSRPVLRKALGAKFQREMEDREGKTTRPRSLAQENDGASGLSISDQLEVIYHSLNIQTSTCCTSAEKIIIKFYKQKTEKNQAFHPDLTLGQYIKDLVDNVYTPCKSADCKEPIGDHRRRYVHGRAMITVSILDQPSKLSGSDDQILMWNCCKLCGRGTPTISMSDDTWKYSFGQYLQLGFRCRKLYTDHLHCSHDLHRDYLRYFGYKGLAVEFNHEPLDLFGVAVPGTRVFWDVEKDLVLRNNLYAAAASQIDQFFKSVRNRIYSIRSQNQNTVKSKEFSAKLSRLLAVAKGDHHLLKRKLEDVYTKTEYYDTLSFNITIRSLQDKTVDWKATFQSIENELLSTVRELSNAQHGPKNREDTTKPSTPQEYTDDVLKDSIIQEPQTVPMTNGNASQTDANDTHKKEEENLIPQTSYSLEKSTQTEDINVTASKSLPATSPRAWPKSTPPVIDDQQTRPPEIKPAPSFEDDRGRPVTQPQPKPRLKLNDSNPQASIDEVLYAPDKEANGIPANVAGRKRSRSHSRFRSKLRSLLSPTRKRRGSSDSNVPPIPSMSEPNTSVNGTFKHISTPFEFPIPKSSPVFDGSSPDATDTGRTRGSKVSGMFGRLRRELKPEKRANQERNQERWPRLLPTKKMASTAFEFNIEDAMTPNDSHGKTDEHDFEDPVKKPITEMQPRSPTTIARDNEQTQDNKDHPGQVDKPADAAAESKQRSSGIEENRTPGVNATQDLQNESSRPKSPPTTARADEQTENNKDHSNQTDKPVDSPRETEKRSTEIEENRDSDVNPTQDLQTGKTDIAESAKLMKEDQRVDSEIPGVENDDNASDDDADDSNPTVAGPSEDAQQQQQPHHTLASLITSFFPDRTANALPPLEYPLRNIDHLFVDSNVLVREDEPTSLIALTLGTEHYKEELQKSISSNKREKQVCSANQS